MSTFTEVAFRITKYYYMSFWASRNNCFLIAPRCFLHKKYEITSNILCADLITLGMSGSSLA